MTIFSITKEALDKNVSINLWFSLLLFFPIYIAMSVWHAFDQAQATLK